MTSESEKLRLALYHMSESRRALLNNTVGAARPTYKDVTDIARFTRALRDTIVSRRRTELRGLGVFEWKPCRKKIPTGTYVNSWRLVFRFCQKHKFRGD